MGGLVSCEDYLTLYPTNTITKEEFWNTSSDVHNVRAAAYSQLANSTTDIVEWGELRSDNFIVNDMNKTHYRFAQEAVLQPTHAMFSWADMYRGINLCNEVLENGQRMVDQNIDPSFTMSEWMPLKAEMTALRALYYFYLVRSFRDVPFVTHSVSTDAEARAARLAATPGAVVMDTIINQVEAMLPYGAINYGSNVDNCGRWTNMSMHALLADMYLWRAGLVMHASKKGTPIKNAEGNALTEAEENALSAQLLKKVVEHADVVLKKKMEEYQERLTLNGTPAKSELRDVWFPLISNGKVFGENSYADLPYGEVFGTGNSIESVFELQFDGQNEKNKTFADLFYGNPDGGYRAGAFTADPALFSSVSTTDPVKGYGRTDARAASYALIEPGSRSSIIPIVKGVTTFSTITKANDVTQGSTKTMKNSNSINSNWQVYRLADVMLIKAEAIARLKSAPFSDPNYEVKDVLRACDELFKRNNAGADTVTTSAESYVVRIRAARNDNSSSVADYANKNMDERYGKFGGRNIASGRTLIWFVYCERQREFLGEGKRWFDLVRECEFRNETKDVLSDWMGATTTVRNRLRSLWSLYNPIYSEEMKVNGVGYGNGDGKLVQNPAWEKYMPKM